MRGIYLAARRLADYFDRLSDSLTTFRSLLYTLIIYIAAACVLSLSGKVSFSVTDILQSALWLVLIGKLSNLLLSRLFNVPINQESDIITALILSLIMSPATDFSGLLVLGAAAMVAMLSKFVLTYNGRHVFNPAAFGAFIAGAVFHTYASWWIASTYMFLVLLVGGFLIVRKMRRFTMVLTFIGLYLAWRLVLQHIFLGNAPVTTWHSLYLDIAATPLIFLASVMLTEPLTSPTKSNNQVAYAITAAVFYSITRLRISPEEALLIANIVAFLVEPNRSLLLKLVSRRQEAAGIYSYIFKAQRPLKYTAGQYMEWTLPNVPLDARGNRRYLTLSSSPTEENVMFTIKRPAKMSSFKQQLQDLKPGQYIGATQLAGSFTLPPDKNLKLAFIAGGVGITPYRSMIKALIDKQESRDIKLFYSAVTAEEFAFKDLFRQAEKFNIDAKYVVTNSPAAGYLSGYVNEELIKNNMSDYLDRLFYISGPQGFVAAVRLALLNLGVEPKNITTDFFPGYN